MKYLFIILLLMSCATKKKALVTDNTRTDTFTETKKSSRQGDTVTLFVPNVKYKDTTITRTNYATNTVLRTQYDSQGNQTVECISGKIDELIQTMKQTQQNDVKSQEEKESSFNPQYIFWALGGLVFIVVVGLIGLIIVANKFKSSILDRITNT